MCLLSEVMALSGYLLPQLKMVTIRVSLYFLCGSSTFMEHALKQSWEQKALGCFGRPSSWHLGHCSLAALLHLHSLEGSSTGSHLATRCQAVCLFTLTLHTEGRSSAYDLLLISYRVPWEMYKTVVRSYNMLQRRHRRLSSFVFCVLSTLYWGSQRLLPRVHHLGCSCWCRMTLLSSWRIPSFAVRARDSTCKFSMVLYWSLVQKWSWTLGSERETVLFILFYEFIVHFLLEASHRISRRSNRP